MAIGRVNRLGLRIAPAEAFTGEGSDLDGEAVLEGSAVGDETWN